MRFLILIALFVTLATPPANAASQILAVLPSDVGVPFACEDGQCRADLSTYCLQRQRPAPTRGTVYLPAAKEDFTLTVKTAKGERTLSAVEHVRFVESRGFMAVSAIIPERELIKLGGLEAAIRVRSAASLLPTPEAGDPNPLTEKEIAYVTRWRRAQGAEIVDGRPEAKAVKLLAGLTNRLPGTGTVRPAILDGLWEQAIGDEISAPETTSSPGLSRARIEYDACRLGPARHDYAGLRRCLEYRHDDLIRDLNIEYWDSSPGS